MRGFVDYLLDQVLAVQRGIHQVGATGFDEHALGSRTDQGVLVLDQHATGWSQRRGNLRHPRSAGATKLENLLHPRETVLDDSRRSSASFSPTMNS